MSTGIDMHITGVDHAGRSVCQLAAELRDARARWDSIAEADAPACGMDTIRTAFSAMRDAWFAEIGVHITILEQLCAALRAAATTYAGAETASTQALRAAAGGFHGN